MDARDIEFRNTTYRLLVEHGRAPTDAEVAAAMGSTSEEVHRAWGRLHEAHALVLSPGTMELRMANPFACVPTAYRVRAAGRWWYANCAWDAFGIGAALHEDARIETSCADCGEPLVVEVDDERPDDVDLLFHCFVPARRWWEDIAFT